MKTKIYLLSLSCVLLIAIGCSETPKEKPKEQRPKKDIPRVETKPLILPFSADSAYAYIEKQVSFGPRVPNTFGHQVAGVFLEKELNRFADNVIVQKAKVLNHMNESLNIKNIIAEFNPDAKDRVLLCAHWDTRPFADQDKNKPKQPADGANDGGSGVGVLLEIARILDSLDYKKGLDIILFDAEDGGSSKPGEMNTWCLGSQYWGENLHQPGYNAQYGILLDMVGAKDALFAHEGFSAEKAGFVVGKVWRAAQSLGFGDQFINMRGGYITDDHQYVHAATNIPIIDIIEYDVNSSNGFGDYWHTHDDNMSVIDKGTLNAVGKTLMKVILTR